MCHHIFDWTQRGIKTACCTSSSLPEEPVACWESKGCVLFICLATSEAAAVQVPRSLQPHMSFHPVFPSTSIFHLFIPTSPPISRSEIKSKHRGDSQSRQWWQDQCWLTLASGLENTPSHFSLIKCLHCVNYYKSAPLLLSSASTCHFFLPPSSQCI